MTRARRYLAGLASVAVLATAASAFVSHDMRPALWWALGLALLVQAPLGWSVVRALGGQGERFLLMWAVGFGARLALVTAAALFIAPRAGLATAPFLFILVGILMAFVVVEAVVPVERLE